LDLLNERQAVRFSRNPAQLKDEILQNSPDSHTKEGFVVIDEVQRVPGILNEVHRLIEDPKFSKKIKFALTGSSARKLKRGGANLLAGRALLNYLHPLTYRELSDDFDLSSALHWGTLPRVVTAKTDLEKEEILSSYFSIYLKEEIKEEQVVRKIDPFIRFLEVAAQVNGKLINCAKIGRECLVDEVAVKRYFQILEDTLLGFFLQPYHVSFRKRQSHQPKFYLFDLGVKRIIDNTIRVKLVPQTYAFGEAFEHFIILEFIRLNDYLRKRYRFSYFRSRDDSEIDLIIERPGQPLALVEIKSTQSPDKIEISRFARLAAEFKGAEAFILCRSESKKLVDGVQILPWQKGLDLLL
jgi:predicted AAA+ superfamily ATPase